MATARKTASKAEELKVSQIGDFKKRLGGVIELPSGLVVKWKNPGGLRAFLGSGQGIPNSLLPMMDRALNEKKGVDADEISEMLKDPKKLEDMMTMYDSITLRLIVAPKVHPVPTWDDVARNNAEFPDAPVEEPDDLLDDDKLYVTDIPDDDKQFLFQLMSGGVKDLATFRAEREINMDAVAAVTKSQGIA